MKALTEDKSEPTVFVYETPNSNNIGLKMIKAHEKGTAHVVAQLLDPGLYEEML